VKAGQRNKQVLKRKDKGNGEGRGEKKEKKSRNVHSISRPRETTGKKTVSSPKFVFFEYPPLASHLRLVAHIMPRKKKTKDDRRQER